MKKRYVETIAGSSFKGSGLSLSCSFVLFLVSFFVFLAFVFASVFNNPENHNPENQKEVEFDEFNEQFSE